VDICWRAAYMSSKTPAAVHGDKLMVP